MTRQAVSFLLALCGAGVLAAQETLEVTGPEPGLVLLGDVARATIEVVGSGANPTPPELPQVPGLSLQLFGPNHSTQMTIVNGRREVRVSYLYQLVITPQREGSFVIPAFAMQTGTREQQVRELRLDVKKELTGDVAWLEVHVAPQRVYVHEPIRIHVDFGIQPGVRLLQGFANDRSRYLDVEVQAPWLAQLPGAEPIDVPQPKGDVRQIVNGNRVLVASFDRNYAHGSGAWDHYSFDRAYLPTKPGRLEIGASTLRFQVMLREGTADLFGNVRGQKTENRFAYAEPVAVEVLPIPEQGRPTPYYGAVGRFGIEASLDKETVTVGGSIKLQLTVRGQGNLEFLRMPELDAIPGFHLLGKAEAQRDAGKVVTTYDIAPLAADVREVPAIGWNYFDTTPGVEKFVEVKTAPLPLHVKELTNGEVLAPLAGGDAKAVTPGVDDVFDLPDLAGEPAVAVETPRWRWWLAAALPWLLVAAARGFVALWRRRAADVTGRRARRALRTCKQSLAAGIDPVDAFAAYLGDRLDVPGPAVIRPDLRERFGALGIDGAVADEVVRAIEAGTAARYGGGTALSAAAVIELAERLEGVRFDARAWLSLVLLPLLLAIAPASLAAQDAEARAAVAAYRAGDFAAADAAFARAFDATADRRFLRARGNCAFRQGDLPRALWAYECARRGLPRDAELEADIALVRARLDLPPPAGGFVAELVALRRHVTDAEVQVLLAGSMLIAGVCFLFGWRRGGVRWIGVLALLPGLVIAFDVLWLRPQPPVAIAQQKLELTSEPRAGMTPVATIRPGVEVEVLGSTAGQFVRVRAEQRTGYAPATAIAVVR